MADPTSVNGQVTDSVTQSNVTVVGDAAAHSIGTMYQTLAHVISLSMQNSVSAQQQAQSQDRAATTQEVNQIISSSTADVAKQLDDVLSKSTLSGQMMDLITSLALGKQVGGK